MLFKKTSNEQYLNYIHDENESTNNNTCRIKVVLVGLCLAGEGWMVGLCLAGEGKGWMVGGICDFCLTAFLKRPFVKCVANLQIILKRVRNARFSKHKAIIYVPLCIWFLQRRNCILFLYPMLHSGSRCMLEACLFLNMYYLCNIIKEFRKCILCWIPTHKLLNNG